MWITKVRADAGGDRSPYGSFWFSAINRAVGGQNVTPDSALALSAVWASVRVLSESFAVLPFRMYKPKGNGGRTQITKHWLYQLLAKAPNQYQGPFEWREMLQGHVSLRGNAYCQIIPDGSGGIAALMPLHPDRMRIEGLPNGSYRYVYTAQDGSSQYFLRTEIFHIRGLSSDGYMGMSPIDIARASIGEGLALQDYSSRFFTNDAKPGGGWIEYPGKFATKEAKNRFRESWQEMQGGANRSKAAVLENGMKFHEIGMKNSDSQFIEAKAAKISDVARIFRIPPHKIGDLSKATFSNIEQQSIEFWQDTMLPWSERWESAIQYQLLGPDSEIEVEFDMRRMMRGDAMARGAYYNTGILAGWLTRNEARDEEGLDPIDGLDEPLTPLNMQTQDQGVQTGEDAPTAPEEPKPSNVVPIKKKQSAERFESLIEGNAARMARRIVAGQAPTAEILAAALAVTTEDAAAWLAEPVVGTEEQIAAALVVLALKGDE